MDLFTLKNYCLSKQAVTESFPFDDTSLVLKVMDKIFAIISIDEMPLSINLKCDPEKAIQLRNDFPDNIFPGYHMNKKHWNTIKLTQGLPPALTFALVDHSYDLVVQNMPKKLQASLKLPE